MTLFFFLFLSFTGEVIEIGGFGTFEACESYRVRMVMREGSRTESCQMVPSRKGGVAA